MFDIKLMEITSKSDFESIDFLNKNQCFLFFHYDKTKVVEDHYFVQKFEEKYHYNLNWIDISDLFLNYKELQNKLKKVPNFLQNYDENKMILNYIKEYIYDQFLRTGKYYKI